MKVYELKKGQYCVEKTEQLPLICESDRLSFGDVFKKDGKLYFIVSAAVDGTYGHAREIEKFNIYDESECGAEIVCPICGWIDFDSWEHASSDGETTCGGCGAVLEYSPEVTVEFTTTVKQKPKVKVIT